jgi:uncharacterized membrane protein
MLGLTTLGIIHTAISLVALATGAIALIRDKKIEYSNVVGKIYVFATAFTCLTAFGIYQHGGFGPGHALGIITLLVLSIALIGEKESKPFGKLSPYIKTVGYTLTFFFHLVPGITETATRLPIGSPMASGPDDPHIQMAIGVCFLLFLIGATLQVRKLRKGI